MTRSFPVEPIKHGDKRLMAAKAECSKCGSVAYHVRSGKLDADQYFRNHGWKIGNGPGADVCSGCLKPKRPELKVVKMEAVKAEPPREMGREDRRIITDKLDEIYDEKTSRYNSPWSDNAVARDLGVPRAWVCEVREQFFGPEGSNPDFDAFIEQAAPIIADLKNLQKSVAAQLEESRKIASKVDELERLGRKIEREIK